MASQIFINGWSGHPHKGLCNFHPDLRHANHLLPQKISHQIDKLSCNFLWGDIDHHRDCHMVK